MLSVEKYYLVMVGFVFHLPDVLIYMLHRTIVACLSEDVKEWVHASLPPPPALSESVLINLNKLHHSLCKTTTIIAADTVAGVKPSETELSNQGRLSGEEKKDDNQDEEEEEKGVDTETARTPSPPMQHLVR